MLVIDGANVVGSVPDGWWRDRAGAAARLVDRINTAVVDGRLGPPVTIVLEGAARAGAEAGTVNGITVVHASGSGDDTITSLAAGAGAAATVITADRDLRRRVQAQGASTLGPAAFIAKL